MATNSTVVMEVNDSEVLYRNEDIAVLRVCKKGLAAGVINSSDSKICNGSSDKHSTSSHVVAQVVKSDVFMNIYDNAKNLSDFVIHTPTKQFPIHKEVLMVHSEKYYNLFTSASEKSEAPKDVALENVSDDIIEKDLVMFLYTGKMQFSPDNVSDILHASVQLHLKNLKEACLQYIKNYTIDTALPLLPVCKMNHMKALSREITDFVFKNFPEIMLTESFSNLDCKAACRLLESYELRIHGERKILEAAMYWCDSHPDQIEICAEQLLETIHFHCISPRDISNCLAMNGDILKIGSCKTKITNAFRYHASQHCQNQAFTSSDTSNSGKKEVMDNQMILAVGGTNYGKDIGNSRSLFCSVMAVRLNHGKWAEFATLPSPSAFHCVAVVAEALYLIGGSNVSQYDAFKPEPSNKVFRFQPCSRQWTEVHPMLNERMFFAIAVVGGDIFVFGGLGSNQKVLNDCEKYSPDQDKWTSIKPMVNKRVGLCASGLSTDYVLVVGGYTLSHHRKEMIKYVEQYDVTQNRWSQKNSRIDGVAFASLVQANNHHFLIGGAQLDDSVVDLVSRCSIETYMIQHDIWLTIAALSVSRMAMGTAVLG